MPDLDQLHAPEISGVNRLNRRPVLDRIDDFSGKVLAIYWRIYQRKAGNKKKGYVELTVDPTHHLPLCSVVSPFGRRFRPTSLWGAKPRTPKRFYLFLMSQTAAVSCLMISQSYDV